jgi:hypothetical protein
MNWSIHQPKSRFFTTLGLALIRLATGAAQATRIQEGVLP